MNVLPIKVISFIALGASACYTVLGFWSAASSLAASREIPNPTLETVQASLIQSSFTNSFGLGAITFLLIGSMGLAVVTALKSIEPRPTSA